MPAGERGSSVFQTIMNTQRSDTASSKANETPCGEFPSQTHPAVSLQKHRDTEGEKAILLYKENGSVTEHRRKKQLQKLLL